MWEKNKAFTKKPQLPHPSGFGHRLWWPSALLLRPQALASTRRRSTVATLACAPAPVSAPGAHAAGAVGQWGGHVGWPVVPADLAKMHIRRPSQNTGVSTRRYFWFVCLCQVQNPTTSLSDRRGPTLQINSIALGKSGHTRWGCLLNCCQQNICFDGKGHIYPRPIAMHSFENAKVSQSPAATEDQGQLCSKRPQSLAWTEAALPASLPPATQRVIEYVQYGHIFLQVAHGIKSQSRNNQHFTLHTL